METAPILWNKIWAPFHPLANPPILSNIPVNDCQRLVRLTHSFSRRSIADQSVNAIVWNTNNHKHDTDTASDGKAPCLTQRRYSS